MKKAAAASASSSNDLKICREAFNLYDTDKSGFIDAKELQQLAYSLGNLMTDEEAAATLKEIDTSGDGKISFAEFLKWWQSDRPRREPSDAAADAKLKKLRLLLLAKYTGAVAESTAADLHKKLPQAKAIARAPASAASAPPAGSAPSGLDPSMIVVEFAANIGNAPTKSSMKISNVKTDPTRLNEIEVVFSLAAGCTPEQANQMRDALGCIVQMAPPNKFANPSVVIRDGKQLVVKGSLPDEAKAASAAKGYMEIVPPEVVLEWQLELSQDFSASDMAEPLALKSALRLKIPRSFLAVIEMISGANEPEAPAPIEGADGDPSAVAPPADSKAEKVKNALMVAKVLGRVLFQIDLLSLDELAAKSPVKNIAQLKAMIAGNLEAVLSGEDAPPPIINFLKLAKGQGLLAGIDSITVHLPVHAIGIQFTNFDLMALIPKLPNI